MLSALCGFWLWLVRRFGAPVIFVSYRRCESADISGRIYDRLTRAYGGCRVIKDVNSIPLGVDFRDYIERVIPRCNVMLVVIGPNWLSGANRDGVTLDDPKDLVRTEVMAALTHRIRIIPILVGGAAMPSEDRLPQELRKLTCRQALAVRGDPDFHWDLDRLIRQL